jgi:hypothetical protein
MLVWFVPKFSRNSPLPHVCRSEFMALSVDTTFFSSRYFYLNEVDLGWRWRLRNAFKLDNLQNAHQLIERLQRLKVKSIFSCSIIRFYYSLSAAGVKRKPWTWEYGRSGFLPYSLYQIPCPTTPMFADDNRKSITLSQVWAGRAPKSSRSYRCPTSRICIAVNLSNSATGQNFNRLNRTTIRVGCDEFAISDWETLLRVRVPSGINNLRGLGYFSSRNSVRVLWRTRRKDSSRF